MDINKCASLVFGLVSFLIPDSFSRFESVRIPSEDPRLAPLGNRLETCRPIGIFRSKDDEFLLCYAGKLSSSSIA